VGAGARQFT